MHRISGRIVGGVALGIVLALFSRPCVAQATATAPIARRAAIGRGMVLHYVDQGAGTPVIFVHGSLSDGGYWRTAGDTTIQTSIPTALAIPPSAMRKTLRRSFACFTAARS